MNEHSKLFTLNKLKSKFSLIEKLTIRKRQSLTSFKYFERNDPIELSNISSAFNDSDWQLLTPPCYWGTWNKNFLLNASFKVPLEFGSRGPVAIEFALGQPERWDACHPEALLYIDGNPLAGVDKFHTLIFLPKQYCDNHKHVLALNGFTGRWGCFDKDSQYKLFMSGCNVADIDKDTVDFVAAARVAFQTIDAIDDENYQKDRIINALDAAFKILETCEPISEQFYTSVKDAHQVLRQELLNAGSSMDAHITAIGHSHIDVAWLWPLEQTRRKCSRTFSTVLSLMKDFENYQFTQSQPQLYDYVRQDYPELFESIRNKVAAGKWELLGGMWVEADCNLTGSESLARQFLLGRTFFADHFGKDAESPVLWLPDVFGYCANLPQLIKLAGLKYFYTVKLSWNQYNQMPFETFWWQGLDGTQVLTHLGTTKPSRSDPGATYNGQGNAVEMYTSVSMAKQRERYREFMAPFGHGDGGGGPTREMLENIREMENFPALPKVSHGKVIDFFRHLEKSANASLPTWNGELYLEWHRGTYTTQANNKKLNRQSEIGIHDAEFLNCLASHLDEKHRYPLEQLQQAWKLICLNQFHDIIPGSSVSDVYEDSRKDYDNIGGIIAEINKTALDAIEQRIGGNLIIINPTSFERNEIALLNSNIGADEHFQTCDGIDVTTQQTDDGLLIDTPMLPPYSISSMKLVKGKLPKTTSLRVNQTGIENDYLKIEINNAGDMVSIYDKINRREIVPSGKVANQFQAFEDRPIASDAWDIDIFYDDKMFLSGPADAITVIESGPLRAGIEIKRTILNSCYTQRISLAYNSSKVDIVTNINWLERHILLKAAFPVNILADQASYEVQWGHVKRPTHRNTSWEWAKFETCAHKWVDLSESDYGVSLLNDCKYGHDIKDNIIRITLLRSPTSPDPKADEGKHIFTYSLMPHSGPLNIHTICAAYALNDPLIVRKNASASLFKIPPAGISMFQTDRANIIIETVKKAENNNGFIVRLYDSLGSRGSVRLTTSYKIKSCHITDLLENDLEKIETTESEVMFNMTPFQIITLRIVPV
jgi:alpha-mannosidase